MTLDDQHFYTCPSCEQSGWPSQLREISRDGFGRTLYKCEDCGAQVTESLLRTAHRWRLMQRRTSKVHVWT
jgi:transposase-like protein